MQLSFQQVLDCGQAYGSRGCDNGTVTQAFDFITIRGLMPAVDYPYNTGHMPCKYQSGTFKGAKSYQSVFGCDNLAQALVKQPVSVAIDGS